MSKSLGNVVDADELADKYGVETLRYYLMTDIVVGKDADFSESRIIERYNTDLANSLGNLLNRTLNMAARYCDGTLRRAATKHVDESLARLTQVYVDLAEDAALSGTMDVVAIAVAREANQYIEQTAPWKMMKDGGMKAVAAILYDLSDRLRVVAILISPLIADAAHGIFDQLNWKMELSGKEERFSLGDAEWGKLPDGHVVGKPTPLFPRIEAE